MSSQSSCVGEPPQQNIGELYLQLGAQCFFTASVHRVLLYISCEFGGTQPTTMASITLCFLPQGGSSGKQPVSLQNCIFY